MKRIVAFVCRAILPVSVCRLAPTGLQGNHCIAVPFSPQKCTTSALFPPKASRGVPESAAGSWGKKAEKVKKFIVKTLVFALLITGCSTGIALGENSDSGTVEITVNIKAVATMTQPAPLPLFWLVQVGPNYDRDRDGDNFATCFANVPYTVSVRADTDRNKTAARMWEYDPAKRKYVRCGRSLDRPEFIRVNSGPWHMLGTRWEPVFVGRPTSNDRTVLEIEYRQTVDICDWKKPPCRHVYRQAAEFRITERT